MTKAELIDRIARSRDLPPDISKKLIGQILGIAFDELASYFARARVTRSQSPRFTFPHFGTFTKKRRSARRGVNPRTLEPIQIEACNTVDFKVSRELREVMNPSARAGGSERVEAEPPAPVAKKKKVSRKRSTRPAAAATGLGEVSGPGGKRRLAAQEDEAAEAARPEGDAPLEPEGELPPSPMQRIKGRRRTRSRGTG